MNLHRTKKLVTVMTATLAGLFVTVAIDRLVGVVEYNRQEPKGIIFTPNSQALYETADFTFRASINSLGFRDHEFSQTRSATYRILAIGDSYTYGWGVNLEDSWPKVLEADLRRDGLDVEIANLGSPGAGPVKYADVAEKAIPLLKPDLVVIGVLQGDDLEQLEPAQPVAPRANASEREKRIALTARGLILRIAHRLYPNLLGLEDELAAKESTNRVTDEWKHEAESILSRFNDADRKHYRELNRTIRAAFESGKLNPPLIQMSIKQPNYWIDTFDPNNPEVQNLVNEMARQVSRIKRVADQYGARVVVASVPMGIYVNNETFEIRREYGFTLTDRMLESDSADSEIKTAAEKAGLPFLTVTRQFRENKDAHFFFKLDTHLDSEGHHFYADHLAPAVEQELRGLQHARLIG